MSNVKVFPLTRRRDLVARVTAGMQRRYGKNAQDYLIDEIEAEWYRLEQFGISADDIGREVVAFGTLIRSKVARVVADGIEA